MTDTTPHTTATTTTEPAPLAPDDPRVTFARAVATAGGVLAAVRPEHLDRPTPCDTMDVRSLGRHLVMVLRRVACAGRAEPLDAWPVDADDVPDDGMVAAWTSAAHEVQAAWTDEALARTVTLPWTALPGPDALAVYVNEITVHTWDLATAIDVDVAWDPAVVAVADAAIHDQLPEADREPLWVEARAAMPAGVPWQDPFGPAVPVADDASPIDRLVAWNGRRP